MNWIDMSDRDKLFNYAKEFKPDKFRIIQSADNSESYFTSSENSRYKPDIMVYDMERFDHMKEWLVNMWSKSEFQHTDLLATIVSATALKNIPNIKDDGLIADNSVAKDEPIKKESCESVNAGDGPPVFIYEF